MRRSSHDEGMRWLNQAAEDLKWAGHLAEAGGHHIACFLAQQVAEKGLKAFLYAQGRDIVVGHSIARLGKEAGLLDEDFTEKVKRWAVLDSYYVSSRYPNGLPDGIPADVFSKEAATLAVELASEVVDYVKQKIGGSSSPDT